MDRRRRDVRAIAYQAVQNIDGLEDTTRNEMIEEQDIHVTDMMIGNAPITPISDVLLCQQILLCQLILRSISGCSFFFTPVVRECVSIEAIDDVTQGRIELLGRDM